MLTWSHLFRSRPERTTCLTGSIEPALPSIPQSYMVLLLGILVWITVMLKLGFSSETTVMLLSAAALAVAQLAGRSPRGPITAGAEAPNPAGRPQ